MTAQLEGITDRDFTATVAQDARAVTVRFTGTADVKVVEPLAALMPRVHDVALREHVPKVIVDFTELEFMSSSCFKGLVSWVGLVQESETKYAIEFRSNASSWQRRSLQALTCFAPDLISVVKSDG